MPISIYEIQKGLKIRAFDVINKKEIKMQNENLGFIGLGLMGSAMVSKLQDLDYQVTVCANKSRPNIEAAIALGAHEVETAYALAQTSDSILLCMDISANVEARMRGLDGVISGLRKGAM